MTPTVHEQIRWVSAAELKDYVFCPADVTIVERLMRRSPAMKSRQIVDSSTSAKVKLVANIPNQLI